MITKMVVGDGIRHRANNGTMLTITIESIGPNCVEIKIDDTKSGEVSLLPDSMDDDLDGPPILRFPFPQLKRHEEN